jgi:mono/diheme cytochrome c family protein
VILYQALRHRTFKTVIEPMKTRRARQIPILLWSLSTIFVCGTFINSSIFADTKKGGNPKPTIVKPSGYVPAATSAQSKRGEAIYNEAHCSACHTIDDLGGFVGPVLDGIGQHRNEAFLLARLTDTSDAKQEYAKLTRQKVSELSPHVRVEPETARPLVAYLLTIPEPKHGFAIFSHPASEEEHATKAPSKEYEPKAQSESSREGRKLYEKFGCAQCHMIQQAGGFLGPQLDGIGRYHDADFIEQHITDAQVHGVKTDKFFEMVPTAMPKFTASKEEISKIRDYLMTLPAQ